MKNSNICLSNKNNYTFTDRQVSFLIFCAIVGFGIMRLPKDAVQLAHTGAWFPIAINTIISLLIGYMFVYLGLTFEGQTLDQYSEIIVGKIASKFITFFFIIYYYSFVVIDLRLLIEDIKLDFLFDTPIWALALLFNFVVFYATYKKLNMIAMLCELYGVIIIIGTAILIIIIFSEGELINIKPFFNVKDIGKYIKAIPSLLTAFSGVEILSVIPLYSKMNNVNRENNEKVFSYIKKIIIIIGLLYILTVESTLSVVGENSLIIFEDTVISTIRRIEIPFLDFLQRIDGLVFSIYLLGVITTLIIMGYAAIYFICSFFKISDNNYGKLVFIAALISQIICMLQIPSIVLRNYFTYLGSTLGAACSIIVPLILITVVKVKDHAKKN